MGNLASKFKRFNLFKLFKGRSDTPKDIDVVLKNTESVPKPETSAANASVSTLNDAQPKSLASTTSPEPAVRIDVHTAEKWQPEHYHLMRPDARMDQKRRFHAVEESLYPLPADIEEQDRLELQHLLYRFGFNARFHMPIHETLQDNELLILDVGCGPGAWARDVAETYPKATVWGVDMAQSLFEGVEVLPNMKFFTGNVMERLPFEDNTFDCVYQRLMILALPADKWDQVIKELLRVLKPGGYLELCETDPEMIRMGPNFAKFVNGGNQAMALRGMNPKIVYELPDKMKNAGFQIVSEHSCSFPMGWDGQHGNLHLVNFQQGAIGIKPYFSKVFNMTSDEFDEFVEAGVKECIEYKTFYNAYAIVGKKI
ncbi:hypothetical protein HK098_003187 [Nowakowskiella sp. JEL0407]|nr:hypothetical protein HK098_003187 [Nowakowskiella sp. JEL0407]